MLTPYGSQWELSERNSERLPRNASHTGYAVAEYVGGEPLLTLLSAVCDQRYTDDGE